jgi:parallel beta-helix repeat protein
MSSGVKLVGVVLSLVVLTMMEGLAATYYVSTSGSDTAPGSAAEPWRTIQNGVNQLQSGDTLMVMAGAYDEAATITPAQNGTSEAYTTLRADGVVTLKNIIIRGSYIKVVGFKATAPIYNNGWTAGIILSYSSYCCLESNNCSDFKGGGYICGIYLDHAADNQLLNNTCNHNVSQEYSGIASGIALKDSHRNSIIGNTLERNYQCGYGNGGSGIGAGISIFNGNNNTIVGNSFVGQSYSEYHPYFTWANSHSIFCYQSGHTRISDNRIGDYIVLGNAIATDITHNQFYMAPHTGIWFGYLKSTYGPLADAYHIDDVLVANNVFHSGAQNDCWFTPWSGVQISNVEVINNIFYSSASQYAGQNVPISNYLIDYNAFNSTMANIFSGSSLGTHNVTMADPGFVNVAAGDYHLLPNSPCRGAGENGFDMGIYGGDIDLDNDFMPDGWEIDNGLNICIDDANLDLDGEGLSNLSEYLAGTKANNRDSDGDGLEDNLDVAGVPPPRVVTLTPEADALVRGGSYSSVNYGSDNNLYLKNDSENYTREAYLRFDLSNVQFQPASAVLRLYIGGEGSSCPQHGLALVENDAWDEAGVTWNSKPVDSGGEEACWQPSGPGGWVEINLIDLVNTELSGDKKLSVHIYSKQNTGGNGWCLYASKEDPAHAPQLVLKFVNKVDANLISDLYVEGNAANIQFAVKPNTIYSVYYSDQYYNTAIDDFNWVLAAENLSVQGESFTWTDSGSATRPAPRTVPMRFYKLQAKGAGTIAESPAMAIYNRTLTTTMGDLAIPIDNIDGQPFLLNEEDSFSSLNFLHGDYLKFWIPADQQWLETAYYKDNGSDLLGWYQQVLPLGNYAPVSGNRADLARGDIVWVIKLDPGQTISLVGRVSTKPLKYTIKPGVNLIMNPFPVEMRMSELLAMATPSAGDVFKYNLDAGGNPLRWVKYFNQVLVGPRTNPHNEGPGWFYQEPKAPYLFMYRAMQDYLLKPGETAYYMAVGTFEMTLTMPE